MKTLTANFAARKSGIVRLIFELAHGGKRPFEIAQTLNAQGFKMRNRNAWTRRQVVEIIKRQELYEQGIFHYGEAQGQNKKLIILEGD